MRRDQVQAPSQTAESSSRRWLALDRARLTEQGNAWLDKENESVLVLVSRRRRRAFFTRIPRSPVAI